LQRHACHEKHDAAPQRFCIFTEWLHSALGLFPLGAEKIDGCGQGLFAITFGSALE
jgi:hypothetical protein